MTILAYKGGILAADSAIWANDVICGHARKINRLKDGTLVAAAGISAECERFARWARETTDPYWNGFEPSSEDEEFCGLIIEPGGHVILIDSLGRALTQLGCTCLAEGSCADLAMGAMLAGASAAEAVALCIDNAAYAGGSVQIERSPKMEKAA